MTPVEKEWQPVKLERSLKYGVVTFGDALADHPDYEVETFVPVSLVRERLLSDETVEAAAVQPSINAGSEGDSYWRELDDEEKSIIRNEARVVLEAALGAAAFLQEEEG